MQGGDLSNQVPPRALFVFEGLVGLPPSGNKAVTTKVAARLRRWSNVARAWEIDETVAKQLWDIAWRQGVQFDIVTYLHEEAFAVALWHRLDDLGLPMSRVIWEANPPALARALAYMPDVIAVFHSNSSDRLVYGSKGRLVTDRVRDFGL